MPNYPTDVKSFPRAKLYLNRPGASLQLLLVTEGTNIDMPMPGSVEVRERGKHLAVPILVETEDSNLTGSATLQVADFTSSTGDYTPLEFLTKAGRGSGLSGVLTGGKDTIEIRQVTWTGSKTETVVLPYCTVSNVNFSFGGDGNTGILSFQWECYANAPTYVDGDVPS